MNKILLLGNTGQVGWELNRTLLTLGELVALDYPEIDMADPASIRSVVREHQPNLIVNATAYTDVDKAESEPELAMAINGAGPGILAEEAQRLNGALIHYSTDYVFDGTKGEPYTEEDEPNPINVYGKTKLAGERAVQQVGGAYLIFRTSWVYSLRRPCFVTKVLQWAREQETLRIVGDQISSPTSARTLAEIIAHVLVKVNNEPSRLRIINQKLYHLANLGFCNRYQWAQEIIKHDPRKDQQIIVTIQRADASDFPEFVIRPYMTVLDSSKFIKQFNLNLPMWYDNLALDLMN